MGTTTLASVTPTRFLPRTRPAGVVPQPAVVASRSVARRAVQAGFSAAELLVVIAIIGMMVLVTTPAMLNFFSSMKVRTASHRLMAHMRLCRQISVSRRTDVLLSVQADNGATKGQYTAWEEKNGNMVRNANGADGTANTEDDEGLVIKLEKQMGTDRVSFIDIYNDTTPATPNPPGSSVVDSSRKVLLRFSPNGRCVRVDPITGVSITTDTLLRMRLERQITKSRIDSWDITINQAGKVGSDFTRRLPP